MEESAIADDRGQAWMRRQKMQHGEYCSRSTLEFPSQAAATDAPPQAARPLRTSSRAACPPT